MIASRGRGWHLTMVISTCQKMFCTEMILVFNKPEEHKIVNISCLSPIFMKKPQTIIFCIFVPAAADFDPFLHPITQVFSSCRGSVSWRWMSTEPQERSEHPQKLAGGGFVVWICPWIFGTLSQTANVQVKEWCKFCSQPAGMAELTGLPSGEPLRTNGSKSQTFYWRWMLKPICWHLGGKGWCALTYAGLLVGELKQFMGDLSPERIQTNVLFHILRKGKGRRLCVELVIHWEEKENRGQGRT